MWTPRRILLLVLGVSLCTTTFIVYNRFLGWINGLPALPERYLAVAKDNQQIVEYSHEDRIRRLLRQAFGANSAELSYRYQLSLQAQGIILAMEDLHIRDDGRVDLYPFSLAVIGKLNPNTNFPEISTVHCDVARITFDHRIETYADIGKSKLVAAEFACDPALAKDDPRGRGYIFVVHNHGTPQTDDDLHVKMPGPVYFEDNAAEHPEKPQLWTTRTVKIDDYQSRPPHSITAQTFNVYLEADALKSGDQSAKAKDHTSPVRKIEMGNVQMQLTIPESSNLLGSPAEAPRSSGPETERPRLTIRTLGSFVFDVRTNRAAFTVPQESGGLRHYVEVTRDQKRDRDDVQSDELLCDRLDLQFRRRTAPTQPAASPKDPNAPGALEIEEAQATGDNVVLTSMIEKLRARGTSLVFNNDRREVVLRGSPTMSAIRDGNRIEAPQLMLHRPDPSKPQPPLVTTGRAPGPGTVYMRDDKGQRSVEARWQGELLMERDNERDRITLSGGAVFDDKDNHQRLQGDEIKIWMARPPVVADQRAEPPADKPDDQHARPEKMHVAGHVKAFTRDFKIDNTPLLVVWFQDVASLPPASGASPLSVQTAGSSPPLGAASPQLAMAGSTTPANQPPPKKPVELSAEYVEATVLRSSEGSSERSEMQHVICRNRVHVHQESIDPNERALDVTARSLDLTHTAFGDVLRLTGEEREPARVEAREMTLFGPQILFDQRDNRVDVDGAGVIVLLTATNLNGEKLERPTPVTIQWSKRMDLVGNRISFHGGVWAEQENVRVRELQPEKELNRMLCPRMDVYLDRPVSLNRLQRTQVTGAPPNADDNPRVKRVVCHRGDAGMGQVTIAGNTWRNGQRVRYQEIIAPEVTLENDIGEVKAAGPGVMRIFQLGGELSETPDNPASPHEQAFNLTRVAFDERMRASNKTQTAVFVGQIRVYHVPTDDPNLVINPDKLPQGAFTLTCRTLEVSSREDGGKHYATMVADGKADIFAPDFSGRADVIKYDQAKKEQIIFTSRDGGNPAVLYYFKTKGEPPMELLGDTILYRHKNNTFSLSGGRGATGSK